MIRSGGNRAVISKQYYINDFRKKLDRCLAEGWPENEADPDNYGAS